MAAGAQRLVCVKARVNKATEGHKGRSCLSFCQPQKTRQQECEKRSASNCLVGLDVLLGGGRSGGATLTLFYRYWTQQLIFFFSFRDHREQGNDLLRVPAAKWCCYIICTSSKPCWTFNLVQGLYFYFLFILQDVAYLSRWTLRFSQEFLFFDVYRIWISTSKILKHFQSESRCCNCNCSCLHFYLQQNLPCSFESTLLL